MPLTELDPNVSGRASRASNMSASSKSTPRNQQPQSDTLSTGVMSMLRTSTELGDVSGAMSTNKHSRASQVPRPASHRRRSNNTSSRVSIGSAQSHTTNGISNHRPRPSSSSAPRRSLTSSLNVPQFVPDTVSPTLMNLSGTSPLVPPARLSKDGRSFSLTTNYAPPHKLSSPRSFASLRHQEPVQRPRSPYRYPTRLRRPGYRSPSPAMSDVAGLQQQPRRAHGSSSIPRTRTSPVSPLLPHEMAHMPGAYPSGPSRSAPHAPFSPLPPHEMVQMPYQAHFNGSAPCVPYGPAISYEVPRRRPVGRNGSVPLLRPVPMRPATSLSNRTDSDIQSSGPPSLAPQTPKVNHSVEVMIHPAACGKAFAGAGPPLSPNSDCEPLYYDYSEQYENVQTKEPQESATETGAVSPGGFVNHIRTLLGERAVANRAPSTPSDEVAPELIELPGSPVPTVPEPVELPASPVPRRITREMILSVIEPSSTVNDATTVTMTIDTKVGSPPNPAPSPSPSESSIDTMSTAQEQVASTAYGDEGQQQYESSESETTSEDSNHSIRASAVNLTTRYSVPLTRASIGSTETFSLEEEAVVEPQVKLELPSESVEIGKTSEETLSTSNDPARPSPTRAKSVLTPRSAQVDVQNRLSAPVLGAFTPHAESNDYGDFAIEVSISPPSVSTNPSSRNNSPMPMENVTPQQRHSGEDELRAIFESPVATPVTFSSDDSTPGSATISTVSVPAKAYSTRDSGNTTTHLVWPIRKQSLPAFEPNEEYPPRNPMLNDPIAKDLRLSNPVRYPSQLSDVKEESCEESCSSSSKRASTRDSTVFNSTVFRFPLTRGTGDDTSCSDLDRRTSVRASTNFKFPLARLPGEESSCSDLGRRTSTSFKFPLPRASGRGASLEEISLSRSSSKRVSTASTFKSARGALGDSRLIPSMNFSDLDLFEKLNYAMEKRTTVALEGVPVGFGVDAHACERPGSLGPIREKYRSFFASLDDTNQAPDFRPKTPETVRLKIVQPEIVEPSRADTVSIMSRPLSPDELVTEIERLSIPSVTGLTQRLSELLPSLKRYGSQEDAEDEDVEKMIEDPELKADVNDIRHLGDRPGLLNNMRSAARLRALPGKSTLVVVNDDVYEEWTQRGKEKEKGFAEARVEELSNSSDSVKSFKSAQMERRDSGAGSPDIERRGTPVAELEAPVPAHIRTTSPTQVDEDEKQRPFGKKSEEVKPWDLSMKFPWNESTTGIDISFPGKAHLRDRSHSLPSKLTSRSPASSSEYSTDTAGRSKTLTGENHTLTSNSTSTHDTFKQSGGGKGSRPSMSVVGTITRKVGRTLGLDNSNNTNSNSGFFFSPTTMTKTERHTLSMDDNRRRPVDPGDRYPTTALTPPARFNIDDVRSFFSDDSSQRERGGSFRKRLTQLKAKIPPMPRSHSAALESPSPASIMERGGAGAESTAAAADARATTTTTSDSRMGVGGSVHTYDGTTGMSKMEFRTKRVLEKIRSMWFRGGEFLRGMSVRRRSERQETRDWLRDSDMNSDGGGGVVVVVEELDGGGDMDHRR